MTQRAKLQVGDSGGSPGLCHYVAIIGELLHVSDSHLFNQNENIGLADLKVPSNSNILCSIFHHKKLFSKEK